MKILKSPFGSLVVIMATLCIYSCVKENDVTISQNQLQVNSRSESVESRYYGITYIDSLDNEYTDYSRIENRLNGNNL